MDDLNKYDQAYNEGYIAGKKDSLIGNFSQNLAKGYYLSEPKLEEAYNAGYDDGVSDYYDDNNSHYKGKSKALRENWEKKDQDRKKLEEEKWQAERKRVRIPSGESNPSPNNSSSDGACSEGLAKLLAWAVGIFIVIWLVTNVVLPLLIIDIAIISLIAGYTKEKLREIAYPGAIFGAVFLIFDYNFHWLTQRLVSNVPFLIELMPLLFVINISAGLVAAYLLISNYLNKTRPELLSIPNKKNLLIGGHVLVGLCVLCFQFWPQNSNRNVTRHETTTSDKQTSTESGESSNKVTKESTPSSAISNTFQPFYILNIAAYKTAEEAMSRVTELRNRGNAADYLWIPDYVSLSGAQLYCVYIGPFSNQNDCEYAVEEYGKKYPGTYGLLVSPERKRVQINGVGKVSTTEISQQDSYCIEPSVGEKAILISGDNVRVRTEPNTANDGNIILRVNKGNVAKYVDQKVNSSGEKWFKICYDGISGWVSGQFASLIVVQNQSKNDVDKFEGVWINDFNPIVEIRSMNNKYRIRVAFGKGATHGTEFWAQITSEGLKALGNAQDFYKFELPTFRLLPNNMIQYNCGTGPYDLAKSSYSMLSIEYSPPQNND